MWEDLLLPPQARRIPEPCWPAYWLGLMLGLKMANSLYESIVSLPIYPNLSDTSIDYIIENPSRHVRSLFLQYKKKITQTYGVFIT